MGPEAAREYSYNGQSDMQKIWTILTSINSLVLEVASNFAFIISSYIAQNKSFHKENENNEI